MKESLNSIRQLLAENELFACIIPNTDPHQSEYIADYWRALRFLTGFTGSTGNVVVTGDFAGVWTDSRYFIQAEQQLQGSGYALVKLQIPHTPEYLDWIAEKAPQGAQVGIDARLFSMSLYRKMEIIFAKKDITILDLGDFLGDIWTDRPAFSLAPIFIHDLSFAGKSRSHKLKDLRAEMKAKELDYTLLSSLDDIAWLYNIRGSDVDFNPTAQCYSLIGHKQAKLFIHPSKVSDEIKEQLEEDLALFPYEGLTAALATLDSGAKLFLDPGRTNQALFQKIPAEVQCVEGMNITTLAKAQKNDTEVAHIREVMVKDGVAMVRFLMWLEQHIGNIEITEVSAAEKLEEFRAEQAHFVGPSFGTIAGYNGNGAIVHYSAEPDTCAHLQPSGIFLLDSGGQYLDGTTDITRTLSLGAASPEQKRDFTLVLKGHIGIATAVFPAGTRGYQIESHARAALWKHGLNYGHGTGHGVGFFLNVHEGPQTLGSGSNGSQSTPFMPGMLTSNEPGIYHSGQYGIRIENLILCVPATSNEFGDFLKFETVTLCPIDMNLVDHDLLNTEERAWLNAYHKEVYEKLAPKLNLQEQRWLAEKTQAFS